MIKCKICESEILGEKLKDHSSKCRDVTEVKEKLLIFINKMENYAEKASSIKNNLETFAAKHKKVLQRSNRSTSVYGTTDTSSPRPSGNESKDNKDTPSVNSIKSSELTENSEEEKVDKVEKIPRKESHNEFGAEAIRKMSEEEYTKCMSEMKKGVFALKKIIAYAHKVSQLTNEMDLDFDVKSELEVISADIEDEKVGEFLGNFMKDLSEYVELKKVYKREAEKLAEVTYDQHYRLNKDKFQSQKSISFNRQKRGFQFKAPQKVSQFKEDAVFPGEDSPETQKRTLPNPKPHIDFATPNLEKRGLAKPSQFFTFANAFNSSNNQKSSSPGTSTNGLLQNNSNHMTQRSGFAGIRGSPAGLDVIKERLRVHIKPLDENKEIHTATLDHQSTLAQYKERSKNKRSRNTATHFQMVAQNGNSKGSPELPYRKLENVNGKEGSRRNIFRSADKDKRIRTHSMEFFRNLHKEEEMTKFPLLVGRERVSPKKGSTIQKSELLGEDKEKNSLHPSKKNSEDSPFGESPSLKGYYSDSSVRPTKKKLTLFSSSQVSMEDFEPIKYIGQGAYGVVWLVRKKATGDEYAMKIVDWADRAAQNRMSALKHESDIYKMLDGDNVVKAIWTFRHENYICFVTEFMLGGDFNKLLDQVGRLEEDQARFYFAELILAIESLHNLGIIHRDLKPDNILMDAKGHIRLTDFGLSRTGLGGQLRGGNSSNKKKSLFLPKDDEERKKPAAIPKRASFFNLWKIENMFESHEHIEFKVKKSQESHEMSKEEGTPHHEKKLLKNKRVSQDGMSTPHNKDHMVGTPDYMAPEIIDSSRIVDPSQYKEECMDWWSMGIILYQFLVGVPPFCDTSVEAVFDNIENYRIEWPSIGYDEDSVTPEAVDLIKKLLETDPSKRLGVNGVQEVKNHSFFKDFVWEKVKEREPPIIPCRSEELATTNCTSTGELNTENDKSEAVFPLSYPCSNKIGPTKRQMKQIDLDQLQFRRLDVLEKLNQETYKNLQMQDSTSESSKANL